MTRIEENYDSFLNAFWSWGADKNWVHLFEKNILIFNALLRRSKCLQMKSIEKVQKIVSVLVCLLGT